MSGNIILTAKDGFAVQTESGEIRIFGLETTTPGYWPGINDVVVWDDVPEGTSPRVRPVGWDDLPVVTGTVVQAVLGRDDVIITSQDGLEVFYRPGNRGWTGQPMTRLWVGDVVQFKLVRGKFAADVRIVKPARKRPEWDPYDQQWQWPRLVGNLRATPGTRRWLAEGRRLSRRKGRNIR